MYVTLNTEDNQYYIRQLSSEGGPNRGVPSITAFEDINIEQ